MGDPGKCARVKFKPGKKEALEKDRKEDRGAGCARGGGGELKTERAQALLNGLTTGLRTTEKEKVKEEEKAVPCGPEKNP